MSSSWSSATGCRGLVCTSDQTNGSRRRFRTRNFRSASRYESEKRGRKREVVSLPFSHSQVRRSVADATMKGRAGELGSERHALTTTGIATVAVHGGVRDADDFTLTAWRDGPMNSQPYTCVPPEGLYADCRVRCAIADGTA